MDRSPLRVWAVSLMLPCNGVGCAYMHEAGETRRDKGQPSRLAGAFGVLLPFGDKFSPGKKDCHSGDARGLNAGIEWEALLDLPATG